MQNDAKFESFSETYVAALWKWGFSNYAQFGLNFACQFMHPFAPKKRSFIHFGQQMAEKKSKCAKRLLESSGPYLEINCFNTYFNNWKTNSVEELGTNSIAKFLDLHTTIKIEVWPKLDYGWVWPEPKLERKISRMWLSDMYKTKLSVVSNWTRRHLSARSLNLFHPSIVWRLLNNQAFWESQ